MDKVLEGRVAVVTGGASGIGAACVIALAEAGADVAIVFHERDATELRDQVVAMGRRVALVHADVAVEADVEAAMDQARDALGVVDILVNSAGLNMSKTPVSTMEMEQWNRVLATDLSGTFLTCRRFVRDLEGASTPAAIINITSVHAFAMRAGAADYDAAKSGQTALTRTLAVEVARRGITVNAIAPGMILTPMNQEAVDDEEYRLSLEMNIPAGRAGLPEEVADLAVFLASPKAAYITGAELVIDGGLSLLQATGA